LATSTTSAPNAYGLVIKMNFYPYSGYTNSQIMFAVRDTSNNVVSLQAEFDGSTRTIKINHLENSAFVYVYSTVATLNFGNRNYDY
jgi:hypothetical protein